MAKAPIPAVVVAEEVEAAPAVSITLDEGNREMFEGCEVGTQKWVLIQIDTHDEAGITATPIEVDYSDEKEVTQDASGEPMAISKIKKGTY